MKHYIKKAFSYALQGAGSTELVAGSALKTAGIAVAAAGGSMILAGDKVAEHGASTLVRARAKRSEAIVDASHSADIRQQRRVAKAEKAMQTAQRKLDALRGNVEALPVGGYLSSESMSGGSLAGAAG